MDPVHVPQNQVARGGTRYHETGVQLQNRISTWRSSACVSPCSERSRPPPAARQRQALAATLCSQSELAIRLVPVIENGVQGFKVVTAITLSGQTIQISDKRSCTKPLTR
jgi:hypothetical protein